MHTCGLLQLEVKIARQIASVLIVKVCGAITNRGVLAQEDLAFDFERFLSRAFSVSRAVNVESVQPIQIFDDPGQRGRDTGLIERAQEKRQQDASQREGAVSRGPGHWVGSIKS